jgi:hypothetical protein
MLYRLPDTSITTPTLSRTIWITTKSQHGTQDAQEGQEEGKGES